MHTFHRDSDDPWPPPTIDQRPLPPTPEVTIKTEAIALPDLCAAFEDYLRGCGYQFDGKVAIVPDTEDDLP